MMPRLLFQLLVVCVFIIVSCQQPATESNKIKTDSLPPPAMVTDSPKVINRTYNDIAFYLAGMAQEEGSTLGLTDSNGAWKKYAAKADASWERFNSNKLHKMSSWIDAELKEVHEQTETVFYPFSGPDFLNMFTFFPDAKKYIMIGLEPIGLIPELKKIPKDSLHNYFGAIQQSLYSILNLSFFKTIDMAEDFKSEQLDGIVTDLFIFIVRTGNTIVDVRPIEINEQGTIVHGDYISAAEVDKNKIYGIEITFESDKDTIQKTLHYFSADLWDRSLPKHSGFLHYLKNQDPVTSYLKSASYLMHKDYFSIVRKIILTQSKFLLQDDSGIPYHFFSPSVWDIKLYGSYDKPINLFKNWYQEDLKTVYNDSSRTIKSLNFGIGYNWQISRSNLMLAGRK